MCVNIAMTNDGGGGGNKETWRIMRRYEGQYLWVWGQKKVPSKWQFGQWDWISTTHSRMTEDGSEKWTV